MRKPLAAMTAIAACFMASTALGQSASGARVVPELSSEPYVFDTAEHGNIKVTVIAKGFPQPFAIDFLPNGDLLLQERGGNLRIIKNAVTAAAKLDPAPVEGAPTAPEEIFSYGVQDIALHPDFLNNHLIYFTFNSSAPLPEGMSPLQRQGYLKLMRGKLEGGKVTDVETFYEAEKPDYAGGSRIHVAKDGMVYVSTPGPFGDSAQDISRPNGKVLRFNSDGSIPDDNPFVGTEGAEPAIFSLGHRDQHGLTTHPVTGDVFNVEHGPNGGDEVNHIKSGGNYGWPNYTFGRNYDGSKLTELPFGEGTEEPVLVWLPGIAPSGLLFYTGDRFPAWQGNLFIGSARWAQTNNTGSLQRATLSETYGDMKREALLTDLHQRVRDIAQGPDGNIYVLTDGPENAVLRIEPAGN
jgi:glucose/arabinose dehydrogenase